MNDIKRAKIQAAMEQLMQAHDNLLDQLPQSKRLSEEDELLSDALDSLEESISCLEELTEG
jgi:hypothetical protein